MARLLKNGIGRTSIAGSRTVNAADTVLASDFLVRVNEAGAIDITLPAISDALRFHSFCIKKLNANGIVTVKPNPGDTIDGASSFPLTVQKQAVTVFCPETGTSWDVI